MNLNELSLTLIDDTQVKFPIPSVITSSRGTEYSRIYKEEDNNVITSSGTQYIDSGVEITLQFKVLLFTQVILIINLWKKCDSWKPFYFNTEELEVQFPDPVLLDIIKNNSIFDSWKTPVWWLITAAPVFNQVVADKPRPFLYTTSLTLKTQVS